MPNKVKNIILEQKIILLIIFLGLVFYFFIPEFLSFKNIMQIFLRVSIEGIIALSNSRAASSNGSSRGLKSED